MPRGILMLALACLVLDSPAEAATTWVGAQLHFPVPAGDIGDSQLGASAGVTLTHMQNAYFGVGADLAYHYWPASSGYVATFDRYLRSERLEALAGSSWAMSALQFTGHVRLVAPTGKSYVPWMQLGAGVYRLDYNLDQRWSADTYVQIVGSGLGNTRVVGGGYGAMGLDVRSSSRLVLGVGAEFHYVVSHKKSIWGWTGVNDMQNFSALTAGVHAFFGWR